MGMDYRSQGKKPTRRSISQGNRNTASAGRSGARRSGGQRDSATPRRTSQPRAHSKSASRGQRRTSSQRTSTRPYVSSRNAATRTRGRSSASAYGRNAQASSSSRLPLVIGGIVVVLALVFIVRGCTGCSNNTPPEESQQTQTTRTAATPLEPGRIVMTINGDADTIVKRGESYIESGCHALDKQEGNISGNIEVSGNVDTSKTGDYTITYTVRNAAEMEASATRTVHVVDDMDVDTDGISVMMYHYVYTQDDPPEQEDANYLLDTKLEAQLQWLTENDYYFPSYEELRAYIDGTHSLPSKSVVLTFDDAEDGFLAYGIPLLEKYQVPATSFIICGRPESAAKLIDYASPYITFQSHSWGLHEDGETNIGRGGHIYDLTEDELVEDCQKAIDMLGTNEAFAYPFGDVSDAAPRALERAGYLCAFTIVNGQVTPGDDPYRLVRMRVLADSPLEGYIYQVEHGL